MQEEEEEEDYLMVTLTIGLRFFGSGKTTTRFDRAVDATVRRKQNREKRKERRQDRTGQDRTEERKDLKILL
eukprot:768552-Hanusia_phi.AAC.3